MIKILAVDDDQDIQKLLKVYLKNKYEIDCVSNGQEALDYLAKGDLPDLILLDMEMPVMNGLALRKKLEENNRLKDIPVVYLTANNLLVDAVKHGSDFDFLNKPIEKDDLLFIIDAQLKYRNS